MITKKRKVKQKQELVGYILAKKQKMKNKYRNRQCRQQCTRKYGKYIEASVLYFSHRRNCTLDDVFDENILTSVDLQLSRFEAGIIRDL